jgi:hypothetical protein
VLLVSTDLSFTRLEGDALAAVVDRTLESVRRLPGVTHASFATMVPLGFGGPIRVNTRVDGYTPAPDESTLIARASITEGYFDTMQIPLIDGRSVGRQDSRQGMKAVVVNQSFVARYWPDRRAVGRRIEQGDGWATVVGVAQNSAIDSVQESPAPLVYHAWPQSRSAGLTLHVRTSGSPLSLLEPVRRQLSAAHADLPALDPGTLADRMQAATFVQFVGAAVFSVFGVIALMIAAVGLYGVVAQLGVERRREVGVIVALGATPALVVRALIRRPLGLALIGLGAGTALALPIGALMRSQVPAVSGTDAIWSIAISAALLAMTAIASCVWPALRATRVDPVRAIRA